MLEEDFIQEIGKPYKEKEVHLFCREKPKIKSVWKPFVYCGELKYFSHEEKTSYPEIDEFIDWVELEKLSTASAISFIKQRGFSTVIHIFPNHKKFLKLNKLFWHIFTTYFRFRSVWSSDHKRSRHSGALTVF